MRANAVVGPTNANPRRLSSFASATDSGDVVASGAGGVGRREAEDELLEPSVVPLGDGGPGVLDGRQDLAAVAHDARLAHQPLDIGVVERRRRRRRRSPAKTSRKASRLARIVAHDSPDWNASRRHPLEVRRLTLDRPPPLVVVVVAHRARPARPRAAGDAVLADDCLHGAIMAVASDSGSAALLEPGVGELRCGDRTEVVAGDDAEPAVGDVGGVGDAPRRRG